MVREAVEELDWGEVQEVFNNAASKKKPLTPTQAFIQAIVKDISRRRTNFKLQAKLCNSLERGTKAEDVPKAPAEIADLCAQLQNANERLEGLKEVRSGKDAEQKKLMKDLESKAQAIISESGRDIYMQTQTRGAFYVRHKISRTRAPISVATLKNAVLPDALLEAAAETEKANSLDSLRSILDEESLSRLASVVFQRLDNREKEVKHKITLDKAHSKESSDSPREAKRSRT